MMDKGQRTKDKGQGHWTDGLWTGLFASVLCLLSVALPAVAAPTNLKPATDEANPIPLLSKELHGYFYDLDKDERKKVMEDPSSIAGYENLTTNTFSVGTPVTLEWEGTSGECEVTVKRIGADKAFYTATVSGTKVEVVNLEIGTNYEWSVKEVVSGATAGACFWTSNEAPRLIKSGTMKLMRDLGGWKGLEGCRVRQNQLFRGGPASDKRNGSKIDDAGRDFFFNVVGLKTEIDFRNASEVLEQGEPSKIDMGGEHVSYYLQEIDKYKLTSYSTTKKNNLIDTIKKLMNIGGTYRPAYFHCKVGRDRTGTVAALILALLGVSEEDIWRDYAGSFTNGRADYYPDFGPYLEEIKGYDKKNGSLTEGARQYCLTVVKVTDEQIETFRKEMLIGYGEPPVPPEPPEWWIEEPIYVTATRITFAAGQSTGTQYRGFLTKKGCEYAWGKDGEALTEWVHGDGTPCDLKKPSDDCELMVR